MLYIKNAVGGQEWHVGEPLPKVIGRVVTFQADGDELDFIIQALQKYKQSQIHVVMRNEFYGAKPIFAYTDAELAETHKQMGNAGAIDDEKLLSYSIETITLSSY